MVRDLKNCTIIIPVLIEHDDRYNNAKTVLNYINKHFNTNVFIYEISSTGSKLDFLGGLNNIEIKHWVEKPEEAFHRTKYLNIMLDEVETPVVANYDIDVLMKPEVYIESVRMIMEENANVVYPYSFGGMTQRMILQTPNIHENLFNNDINLDYIDSDKSLFADHYTEYGHCIFFNTNSYRRYGAENENFVSYGPEDKERGKRFVKLGLNVRWVNHFMVYHLEHYRGSDSSHTNSYFNKNWEVYNHLETLDMHGTLEYYSDQNYIKKYKNMK
jgi:hypothetical protein